MSFWDFFWLMIWFALFVAYLMVLFQIIADIFRDRSLGGWARAGWLIFLLLFPPLTALIYLIARGRTMGERQMQAAVDQQASFDQYVRSVATPADPAEAIAKAKSLLDSGAITQEEFDALKAKALG